MSNKRARGNGEGSFYFSECKQKWIGTYYDNDNNLQYIYQKKNEQKGACKKRWEKAKANVENGTYMGKSKESIISLASHYVEQKHDDGITSDRSYRREKETLEQIKKTCSKFCYIPIQKVTIKHIENAKKEIKQYSNGVIDKIWSLLDMAFAMACSPSRQLLIYNLMKDENLKKPISIKPTKKPVALTEEEQERLYNVLNNEEKEHPYSNVVKMELISGMRIGEVLARSIDDFDKETGKFDVHNTLTEDANYHTILGEHTKTYNKKTKIDMGRRWLPLYDPLFNEIVQIIEEQKQKKITNIHKLLFWDYKKNTFITPNKVDSWLRRIDKKYKITRNGKPLSSHRLRKTALTHWREIHLDERAIQFFAGHVEGSKITDKVYIATREGFLENALKEIANRKVAN